jgi:hypothetical protein
MYLSRISVEIYIVPFRVNTSEQTGQGRSMCKADIQERPELDIRRVGCGISKGKEGKRRMNDDGLIGSSSGFGSGRTYGICVAVLR